MQNNSNIQAIWSFYKLISKKNLSLLMNVKVIKVKAINHGGNGMLAWAVWMKFQRSMGGPRRHFRNRNRCDRGGWAILEFLARFPRKLHRIPFLAILIDVDRATLPRHLAATSFHYHDSGHVEEGKLPRLPCRRVL